MAKKRIFQLNVSDLKPPLERTLRERESTKIMNRVIAQTKDLKKVKKP
jgi:hypothetical protein